jgi:hypothetical protein
VKYTFVEKPSKIKSFEVNKGKCKQKCCFAHIYKYKKEGKKNGTKKRKRKHLTRDANE